jgi:predicted acyltransferase
MFFYGDLLIFAGLMLSTWMPINKKLWTSSYSVFMAGMAFVIFASCYWMVDVNKWRRFSKPFEIYGMNAVTVYALSGILAKTLIYTKVAPNVSLQSVIYQTAFQPLASPKNASLLYALANVGVLFGVAYFMYRKRWIVRL